MRKRIKKYYEDHKDEIVAGAVFAAYAGACGTYVFYKLYDGNKVIAADAFTNTNNPMLLIHMKNRATVVLPIVNVD